MSVVVEDLVGLSAARSLSLLLSSLQAVREVRLARLLPLRPLQNRINLTASEREVFEKALALRSSTGLSFWDAVLLQLPSAPEAVRLLDNAIQHVSLQGLEQTLTRVQIDSGELERICQEFPVGSEESLTILSEIVCEDGSIGHLPMVDFHAFKSPSNQQIVLAVAKRLFPAGAVLMDSGESYHAYGTQILSVKRFRQFLGTALLCAPIVDRVYVAHQLIEGRCALRLTPGGGKANIPTVIAVLTAK